MKKLLAALVLTAGLGFGQVSVGIGIHIGPPPAPIMVAPPPPPGPEFSWVDGYWYPVYGRYRWHAGYWTRPPYPGARWVGPRHDGAMFYSGFWDGDHGRFDHDHHWDRDHRNRDFGHDHGRGHGHD
jgi:hypothetical protein